MILMRVMLVLAGAAVPLVAAGQPIEVVSLVGRASADGQALRAGARLSRGTLVELHGRRAVVQLVLDDRLAVGLCRSARARLMERGGDLELHRGAIRLTGTGSVVLRGMRTELERGELVIDGATVHLIAGRATARLAAETVRLSPGQAARLTAGGGLLRTQRAVEPDLVTRTMTYAPPGRWEPTMEQVALGRSVKEVRQRVMARQQREREMASCGCTEGSGPGAQIDRTRGTEIRPEARPAVVRVRVVGVPRLP